MKLQGKIIALLLPLILLPIIALGALTYQQINSNFISNSYEKITNRLDQTEKLINLKIDTALSNIKLFSGSGLLEKYILTEDETTRYVLLQGPLQRLFSSYQKAYPDYYEIRVILPDGYEDTRQVSVPVNNLTEFEQDTPFIKNMMYHGEDNHHEITINPDTQNIVLYVSQRLILQNRAVDSVDEPAKLRGYLVLSISLDSIQQQLDTSRIGTSGILMLADSSGNILLKPGDQALIDKLGIGTSDDGKYIHPALMGHLNTSMKNAGPARVQLQNTLAYTSVRKLEPNLLLFAWLPDHELVQQQNNLRDNVLAIMLFTALITTGLLFAALKYFVLHPIDQLESAAKAIGHGQLDNTITVYGKDEMGSLARSLQQMSSNLKTTNERIRYIAYHDALTGLPNRLMFREYLGRAIASAIRNNRKLALLFLDLDNFKRVNDTLGHESGDQLLREISERLEHTLRGSDYIAQASNEEADDVVARLGGDEFIILLTDVSENFVPGHVASRILESLSQGIKLADQEIHASVSIGITICPDDSDNPDELIKNADIAMYHAKRVGKNNYQYFSSSLNEAVSRRLKLETSLREAIARNLFHLAYQPQIDIASGRIIGVEALLRWHDDEQGNIAPDEFIPVAEDSGLILPLGEWVLDQACAQLGTWKQAGLDELTVAVNVSSVQFARQELPEMINKALKKHHLSPGALEIELTESIFLHDQKHASDMLFSIRTMGVEVSLDDFGTGYSSLAYLRKFPIDNLKIDRSFINEISHSREGEEVITAIIRMAHAMNLRVIGEGVETGRQLTFLREQNCDYVQGFYFYKPLSAQEITTLLHAQLSGPQQDA